MSIPSFAIKYNDLARKLISEKNVKDIIFSDGSYQVGVYDNVEKMLFWPFIQLDDKANVRDAFCSCYTSEEKGECVHLAAAYFVIFKDSKEPLANRYYRSFFHQLCLLSCIRIGPDPDSLKKITDDTFLYTSKTNKQLFRVYLEDKKSKKKFKEIIQPETLSNETTSLKYSQITEEELKLWKEGKASKDITYELSFWSDLGKWIYFLQEQGYHYQVNFKMLDSIPPREVEIKFQGLFEIFFYISESSLKYVIPSLKTIVSPIKVIEQTQQRISEIVFHEKEKAFEIISKPFEEKLEKKGYSIGEWEYIKNVGFYKKSLDPLAEKKWIKQEEISFYLSEYLQTFQEKLKKYDIYPHGIEPSYHLFFDEKGNLHIQMYIFDLKICFEEETFLSCPWLFLKDKGFYLLKDPMFFNIETVVKKNEISDFIHKHRLWLHQFEGFHTHYGVLPTQFFYKLTSDRELEFLLRIDLPQSPDKFVDLDDWLYVEGHGFYLKKDSIGTFPIRSGLKISKDDVSEFIESHVTELESVNGFFASNTPIEDAKLKIYTENDQIVVDPIIHFKSGYDASKVIFFGKYVYVENEGFSKIPIQKNIFERFWKRTIIPEDKILYFLNYELDYLRQSIDSLDKSLNKPARLHLKIKSLKKEIKRSKISWLVDLSYKSDLGEVSVVKLWEYIQEKRKFAYTNAGFLSLIDHRYNWISQINKRKINLNKKYIRLNTLEFIRLCIYEKIKPPRGASKEAKAAREFIQNIFSIETDKTIDLSYLKSTLWPYQEMGVKWLWFLYSYGLSGLLCDDMGLGKTHQAMALLSAVLFVDSDRTNKYLVICPTSVIYHWENLFKKYLPEIRVLTYYGVERSLDNFEDSYDLILTSYGTLRASMENLKKYNFEVSIFDEIQVAKNPSSQTHRSLKALKSSVVIGLTGTPIENSLRELKALFDLILPSYMPSDSVFRDLFLNPIEKNEDKEKKELLSKLINPFVLRRKKVDVLTDLPEKIEELAYCKLSEEQEDLYNMHLRKKRNELIDILKKEEDPIPYMHIFALFTKLKQICDHPALFHKDSSNYQKYQSGKWELFVELLQEAKESNQKVVIFSQYLEMIEIIEKYLRKKNINYGVIKGSTKNRYQQIQKFQTDPNCQVFVASLLAAGVGIDLTAGSVVIHYDRWWNPAKENQATDRVHRIGQNRGVQVFKLITKGTIEEHIHKLIEKKHGLMEELIGQDESDQIKRLTRDELLEVLEQTKGSYLDQT